MDHGKLAVLVSGLVGEVVPRQRAFMEVGMAIGKKVLESIKEILDYEEGRKTNVRSSSVTIDDDVDVRAVRDALDLSQQKFADLYGLPVATIQNWESGRRKPELAAKLLLKVIEKSPDLVAKAIRAAHK
jgi:putative transcriptional regulator